MVCGLTTFYNALAAQLGDIINIRHNDIKDEQVEDTLDLTSETSSSDDGPEESDVGNAQKTGCFEPLVQLSERIKLLLRRKK